MFTITMKIIVPSMMMRTIITRHNLLPKQISHTLEVLRGLPVSISNLRLKLHDVYQTLVILRNTTQNHLDENATNKLMQIHSTYHMHFMRNILVNHAHGTSSWFDEMPVITRVLQKFYDSLVLRTTIRKELVV